MKIKLSTLLLCLSSVTGLLAQAPGPNAGFMRTLDGLPTVMQFPNVDRTGAQDSTVGFNAALSAYAGKVVRVPGGAGSGNGTYLVGEIDIPSGTTLLCDAGVKLVRDVASGSITAGHGWIDINAGAGSGIVGCFLEGGVTTSATFNRSLLAGLGSTAAVSSTFTLNSCLWIHGGTNISVTGNTFSHCGGYPQINDASAATISGLTVTGNIYQNNRSFLWGDPGDYNYGSWQGGILNYTASSFYIENATISRNKFLRNTGHGIFWDALNGNSFLNKNIIENDNTFHVIGLDAIENSGMSGVTMTGNSGDSIGFISVSDSDNIGTPRWYNGPAGNVNAVALDHASVVVGENLSNNTFRLINGGAIDADGLGRSKVSLNHFTNPMPGDADFNSSVAATMGPSVYAPSGITSAGQNWNYGYNAGNTNNTALGGNGNTIEHNSFYGFGCSIKFYGGRNSLVEINLLTIPGDSNGTYDHNFCAPITLGTVGTGVNQRAYNNTITKNKVVYSGSGGLNLAIEDATYGAFSSGDRNFVYDNDPTPTGSGTFAPFLKDANTSSMSFGSGTNNGGSASASNYTWCNSVSGTVSQHCIAAQADVGGLDFYLNGGVIGSLKDTGAFYAGSALGSALGVVTASGTAVVIADNAVNLYGTSLSAGPVGSTTVIVDSLRDMHGDSLSLGTAVTAALPAGLTIDPNRNATLQTIFIGTHGSSPLEAIDGSNNHTANSYYIGSSVSGNQQFALADTTDTGCSVGTPCANLGNINNFVQSNSHGTVSFAAPIGLGGTVNATGLGSLTGSGSLLCLDGSGFIRQGCPAATVPLFLGSPTYTGNVPMAAQSAGAFDNSHDYSSIVGLLGASATGDNAVLQYFHPFTYEGLVRESGIVGAAVTSPTDSAWETNGVTGMVVANNSSCAPGGGCTSPRGGGSVAGAFYALGNTNGATAWGLNTYTSDINRAAATSTFDYSHNSSITEIGMEMDHQTGNVGTVVFGINSGIAYLGISHTNTATSAININQTGSAVNYWDYGYKSNDGAAITGIYLGLGDTGASGSACSSVFGECTGAANAAHSQFIDFHSGPDTSSVFHTGRMYADSFGDLVYQPSHTGSTVKSIWMCGGIVSAISCGAQGDFVVQGTASQPSIVTLAGYMQSADGFLTTSTSSNAFQATNGGFSTVTGVINSTSFNGFQAAGGGIFGTSFVTGGSVRAANLSGDIDQGNKLEVVGGSDIGGFTPAFGGAYISAKNAGSYITYMGSSGTSGFVGTYTSADFAVRSGNLSRIYVTAAGLVGLGNQCSGGATCAPSTYGLELNGGTGNAGVIEATGGFYTGSSGSSAINVPNGTISSRFLTVASTFQLTGLPTGSSGMSPLCIQFGIVYQGGCASGGGGSITGVGTSGDIPIWTGSGSLGNSHLSENSFGQLTIANGFTSFSGVSAPGYNITGGTYNGATQVNMSISNSCPGLTAPCFRTSGGSVFQFEDKVGGIFVGLHN